MKALSVRLKKDAAGKDTFKPQLTSLIDVMTILLVFLIKSFSAEGNLVTQAADLTLPESTAKKSPRLVATIEITHDHIVSEGTVLAALKDLPTGDRLEIPGLHRWMMDYKDRMPEQGAKREVMIQSDKEIEFSIIKRVMYTCSKAGFTEFSILVMEEA